MTNLLQQAINCDDPTSGPIKLFGSPFPGGLGRGVVYLRSMGRARPPKAALMRHFRRAILSIVVALVATSADAEQVVVIGTFSDAMSAEAACQIFKDGKTAVVGRTEGQTICASVRDPKYLAAQVEGEVMNELATNPRCKGVTVVSQLLNFDVDDNFKINPAMHDLIAQNDYWELDVDYWPVKKPYSWALWPKPSLETAERTGKLNRPGVVLGEDTPPRIADRVCTVVTGQGANIR
jgi:hypothetical protein